MASAEASDQGVAEICSLRQAARLKGVEVEDFTLPTSCEVVLRDLRFHYLDWGLHGLTPMLFLHGGGLTAHTYDLVCLSLKESYHCIALDQRGHGDSAWPERPDYDIDSYVGDIEAFVDYLLLRSPVIVGMSLGGLNAIRFASRHPKKLKALVLIDVGPEMQASGAARIASFRQRTGHRPQSLDQYLNDAVRFNPRRDRALLRRSLLHNLRETGDGNLAWKWDPRLVTSEAPGVQTARRLELWQDVDRIACPTLVVRGGNSDVFSEANATRLVARLPLARYARIEEAGHTVQGDAPAQLVRAIRLFLEELTRQGIEP